MRCRALAGATVVWCGLVGGAWAQFGGRQEETGKADADSRQDASIPALTEDDEANEMLVAQLSREISISGEERSLDKVVREIAQAAGVPIVIDEKALEDASITIAISVTPQYISGKARTALKLLLEPHDLAWEVRDSAVIVTSKEAASMHLALRVYAVGDLLGPGPVDDFNSLIDLITSTVAPTTWDEAGGPCSIALHRSTRTIVVSQTRDYHETLAALLRALRKANWEPAAGADAAEDVAESPRHVVRASAAWQTPRVHK